MHRVTFAEPNTLPVENFSPGSNVANLILARDGAA